MTTAISSIVGQVIQLQVRAHPTDWLGLFDRLEVWRGPTEGGPYTELTAVTWMGARVPTDAGDPPVSGPAGPGVILVGKILSLFLDEQTQVDITFTGVDPLTYAQAAAQISAKTRLATSYVASDGRVVVQSVAPGNRAILRILATDAASLLGLPTVLPVNFNYGKDARIQLTESMESYPFIDYHGDATFFYKTRFRNSSLGTLSDFSTPFSPGNADTIDASLLITGFIDLVDIQGRPVQNREVSISTKFSGLDAGGRLVTPTDQRMLTDIDGHAEFQLIRGTAVVVSVAGTMLTRDVTVPTNLALTAFRLMDPNVGSDDVFVVQVPNVDFAVRRAL